MIRPEQVEPSQSEAELRSGAAQAVRISYRRSQVFGLLLIASVILAGMLLRADPHTLFAPGWWR